MKHKSNIIKLEKIIREHPLFSIIDFKMQPGASKASLTAFKNKYGFDPDPALAALYSEMNGYTLTYKLKDDSESTLEAFTKDSEYNPDQDPIGSINFLTFEEAFLEDGWKGVLYDTNSLSDTDEFTFNRETYTYNSFGKKLNPFDTYSEESCAAILVTDKNRFDVILLEDHYADWKNSRIIDFETYLKFILLTGGLVEARTFFLSEIDGDEMPKLLIKDSKSLIPPFFNNIFNGLLK